MQLSDLLTLEPHGPDTWVGTGPSYPWGGLYGGQIVAQGLMAASHSVPEQFAVIASAARLPSVRSLR